MTEVTPPRGDERRKLVRSVLLSTEMEAMVSTYPSNILMLTGYWPVVGTSIAIATRNGQLELLVPTDEEALARTGWADRVSTYSPGSLENLEGPVDTVIGPLGDVLRQVNLQSAVIGHEIGPIYEESSYSATFRFLPAIASVLRKGSREVRLTSADDAIRRLRYALTSDEVDQVRLASRLCGDAYEAAKPSIKAGTREPEVASTVSTAFEVRGVAVTGVQRCGAFAWCMSGLNSANAGGAFAMTTNREIRAGDLVLVHSNPYVDGYFGDVTRTYVVGEPDPKVRSMFEAIFAAREASLAEIRPGAKASVIDGAARKLLTEAGFGKYFTHGTGHSVGFSAVSADFPPRIHPASADVLEVGCTFNLEPAIYMEGLGGIRHCDVVTVTAGGYELLTPFDGDYASCLL